MLEGLREVGDEVVSPGARITLGLAWLGLAWLDR